MATFVNIFIWFHQIQFYKNILFSMLLPKLRSQQKQKLVLNQSHKYFVKAAENNFYQIDQKLEKENVLRYFKEDSEHKQKVKKSHSSGSKCPKNISRHSLMFRKIESTGKSNLNTLKINRDGVKTVQEPFLRVGLKTHNCQNQKQNRRILTVSDFSKEDSLDKNNNSLVQNSQFSQIATTNFIENQNDKNAQKQIQNQEFCCVEDQNSIILPNSKVALKNSKRNPISKRSRKYIPIIQKSLSLDCSVFSLNIDMQSNQAKFQSKKTLMVEELANDPCFEWKYRKFKQYCHMYSEVDIELKQKTSILQCLTENLQLIKKRIIPFQSFESLTEIVQMLKPTMTKKQESAYETKMEMLEWKKKFFTNVLRTKENFTSAVDKKSKVVVATFNLNLNILAQVSGFLAEFQNKETVTYRKYNFSKLNNFLQKMVLNQKQMIDGIQICQRETEFLFDKFNSIEQEWSHAFDIFDRTLENCVNKCMILAQIIEKFYGKCSSATFLTKGFQMQDPIDTKMIQNDNCGICKWNEIKLKKIIQQNSLAKDHLLALRHLIAN